MTNILSVLVLVKTVCKGYQQMTKVADSKEKNLLNQSVQPLHNDKGN